MMVLSMNFTVNIDDWGFRRRNAARIPHKNELTVRKVKGWVTIKRSTLKPRSRWPHRSIRIRKHWSPCSGQRPRRLMVTWWLKTFWKSRFICFYSLIRYFTQSFLTDFGLSGHSKDERLSLSFCNDSQRGFVNIVFLLGGGRKANPTCVFRLLHDVTRGNKKNFQFELIFFVRHQSSTSHVF